MRAIVGTLLLFIFLLMNPIDHAVAAAGQSNAEANSPDNGASFSLAAEAIEEGTRVNILFDQEIDHDLLAAYQAEIIHEFESVASVTVKINPDKVEKLASESAVKALKEDQLVEKEAQLTSWGHGAIHLQNRIPVNSTGKGIKIAIIDSGVDNKHPDLKVAGGVCVLDTVLDENACNRSYMDDNGHGTHVAGIISAQDNAVGTVGVAPGASIYALKALDSQGYGTTSSILAGLDWSIKNKMNIINLSLSTPYNDPSVKAMVDKAYGEGILLIAAAGNEEHITGKEQNVQYPAKYDNVIAVSSLGENRSILKTSSIGTQIELTAPGGNIYSTVPVSLNSKGYASMSGTSMASPFVAGLAALYMEKYPEMTHKEIRELLHENAKDLGAAGKDPLYGHGLIQADTAVEAVSEISVKASENGTVDIEVISLPDGSNSYNLYRFDKLMIQNGTSTSITDYAGAGKVGYKLVPLINGEEVLEQAKKFSVWVTGPTITDMKNDFWFNRNIMYLHQMKVMNGYSDSLMKPFQTINRGEAIIMIVNALGLDLPGEQTVFKDVAAGSSASGHIAAAHSSGIVNGFPDGTFRPYASVTRAEMSIMISRAFELQSTEDNPVFPDVNSQVTGHREIAQMAANGITNGYEDGTFRPYEKMNRATYAVFVSRAMNKELR